MRVLITRPREDAEAIAARLLALGHQPLIAPLLEPRWFNGPPLDLSGIAAILATSANGVRALAGRTARRDIAIFAVGPQTTQEARDAGFARVENADGDARALAAAVPRWIAADAGALLHVCGEESAGNLGADLSARGYDVRRATLYAVDVVPLTLQACAAVRGRSKSAKWVPSGSVIRRMCVRSTTQASRCPSGDACIGAFWRAALVASRLMNWPLPGSSNCRPEFALRTMRCEPSLAGVMVLASRIYTGKALGLWLRSWGVVQVSSFRCPGAP